MPTRFAYFLGFIVISILLLISLYLEHFEAMIPCLLCSVQRITFCVLGVIFLTGIFLNTHLWQRILLNTLGAMTAILGLIFSGRQIWIQHFPIANSGDCSVSFGYLIETFPMNEVLERILLEGGTECAKRGFEFLHFNMAEWAFIWFFLFLIFIIYLFLHEIKKHHHPKSLQMTKRL